MEHVPSADVTELELPEQETIDKTNEKDEQSEDIQLKSTSRSRTLQLPLSRVKNIMKCDPDVSLAGTETVYLIAKCTELFVTSLTRSAYEHTVQGKRKTIQRKDIDNSISQHDHLTFLEGILDKNM